MDLIHNMPRHDPVARAIDDPAKKPSPSTASSPTSSLNVHADVVRDLHQALATREPIAFRAQRTQIENRNIKRNKKNTVVTPDFEAGDWVLVRRAKHAHKFEPHWQFARIQNRASPDHRNLWRVQFQSKDPDRRIVSIIHADRIKRFDSANYERTPELDDLIEYFEDKTYTVEELLQLRKNIKTAAKDGEYQVQIKWEGYARPTWEPLVRVHQDVPHLVEEFLADPNRAPPIIADRARRSLIAPAAL
jgi:hypothetical protein